MSVEIICKSCGKSFSVIPSRANAKYCSKACMYDGALLIKDRSLRKCCMCHQVKPLVEFASDRTNKDGYDRRCVPCVRQRAKEKAYSPKGRYQNARSVAKRESHEWHLSQDDFTALVACPCSYCNGAVNPTSLGLDRKDNSKGYTLDNAAPCCTRCNRVKNDHFTFEEMLQLGQTIQDIDAMRIKKPQTTTN